MIHFSNKTFLFIFDKSIYMKNEKENELLKENDFLKKRNNDLKELISDIVSLASRDEGLYLTKKSILTMIGRECLKEQF